MRPYSLDLRQRIIEAYQRGEGSQAQLAQRFQVSTSFLEKLLRRYRTTGSSAPAPHGGGRPRAVTTEQEALLRTLITQDNGATDAEIAARFSQQTGQPVRARTINRMWKRLAITRKKRRSGPASDTERT